MRPGTDIPVLYGMMWHILQNGWEDKEFIKQRVYGFDDLRKEVEKWNPEEVERVSGVPGEQLKRVAKMFATEKPSTLIWAMGQTQKTVGTANVRASCIALLMTGNVGKAGTGANIFRGHDNVQGATDVGLDIVTLPFYYGSPKAPGNTGRGFGRSTTILKSRFDSKAVMETPGIPLTRWFDAVTCRKTGRAERQCAGGIRAGPCQQQHHPHSGIPERSKGARTAGHRRPASDHLGLARRGGRAQGWRLHSPGCHAIRVQGFARRLEPLAAMGRADRKAGVRIEG
jgi:Uncharacterized anaerobic dehydrogenase